MNKLKNYLFLYGGVLILFVLSLRFPFNGKPVETSLIAMASGMVICLAGAIFQTAFKNPLASPSILGVGTGISIGNIIFIYQFQLSALIMLRYRYIYCYALAIAIVFLVVALGRLFNIKTRDFSVESMIIMGMIISHLGSAVTTYYRYQIESDDTGLAEIYETITSGNALFVDNISVIVFITVSIITSVPMLLLGYKYNMVAFDDDEAMAMGVSNLRIRTLGLILGSLMAAAAMIHCGDVGFLSLMVPFMCRKKHPEFRDLVIVSMAVGAMISLASRVIYYFAFINGLPIPVGTILTVIAMPIFIIYLFKNKEVLS